jgi:sialate O-acetylesterase
MKTFGVLLISLFLLMPLGIDAFAAIRLPAIIGSGMVLQQQADVKLWGWGTPNQTVAVAASWNSMLVMGKVDDTGRWEVTLRTPSAGGPFNLTVGADGEIVNIDDVLIGEVWFCSGQSNMEFPVGQNR